MDYFDIQVEKIVERALEEDLGWGDVTTDNLIPEDARAEGTVVTRDEGKVCGVGVIEMVFSRVDPETQVQVVKEDGEDMHPGDVIARVQGSAGSLLRAERVALNFMQRMSGIATVTARYVDAVRGLPVRIADTRKTAPGLRVLDKYAVRMGGGLNHRLHLGDGVLIKDNHLALMGLGGGRLKEVVSRMRRHSPRILSVEVEAKSVEEARAAAEAGADIILLDNMDAGTMKAAVDAIAGRALIEASGGMSLERVRSVAETGVDFISVGALTHSVRAMDIALDIRPA
ncbi:MAG: carboxylating nicotinate-nucleotide diphosphorylase [Chloroflexi bacterium]|nr:carboxylating nicotinate-nucleotide diphosphorylase [Chloroflexota bacterium]